MLPLALTFGMSAKEFWEDDPELLWAYRKSYTDKTQQVNFEAWLHGLYVFDAVNTVIYNGFCRKSGQPAKSYASEPYDFTKSETERAREQIAEREASIKEQLSRGKKALRERK